MGIETIIIIYVLGLMLEVALSLSRFKILAIIPIMIFSIIFLITKEENFYLLAFYQIIVFFITIIAERITNQIAKRKQNSAIDKLKIKDLE